MPHSVFPSADILLPPLQRACWFVTTLPHCTLPNKGLYRHQGSQPSLLKSHRIPEASRCLAETFLARCSSFTSLRPPAVPTDLNPQLQILATTIGDQLWVCSDSDLLHPPSLSKVTSDKNLAPVFTGSCARAHSSSHLPRSLCWIHGMNN